MSFTGDFLETILSNINYQPLIVKLNDDFNSFIKECFICDLILMYNKSGNNDFVATREVIPIYYNICKKHIDFINTDLRDIRKGNNQEGFRNSIRNTLSSNASHINEGLQFRSELLYIKRDNNNLYKLSDGIIKFNYNKNILSKMIFVEKYPYLYNFRSFLINDNIKCRCGEDKNIFIAINESIKNKIPLPISTDITFLCSKCILSCNTNNLAKIYRKDK